MFGFLVNKRVETPAEQRLEEIREILFPPHSTKEHTDPETEETVKIQIDYSADLNLDSALYDIREGYSDEVVQKTIQDVLERLYKIRKILNAEAEIDSEAKYIIVDNKNTDSDIKDIDISDE